MSSPTSPLLPNSHQPNSSLFPATNQSPIQIEAIDEQNALTISCVDSPKKNLCLYARLPDGRVIPIKILDDSEIKKSWDTLKTKHAGDSGAAEEINLDLSKSRLEFQTPNGQSHRINLYKDDLEPIYQALKKIKFSYEADGKTKEQNLSEFVNNLPTHKKGQRAASQAKAGLEKDDPRLKTLRFGEEELVKVLDEKPLNESGLKDKFRILKRKKGAEFLISTYQRTLQEMQKQAASLKTLAGQSQEQRLAQLIGKPFDHVAINFNAAHPFPEFSNPNELKDALNQQLKNARKLIESHPIPSSGFLRGKEKIDQNKEDLYAKELVLAGLPETFESEQGVFDQRGLYEFALTHFDLKPTRDPQETAFIHLANAIAETDSEEIENIIRGPAFESILESLNPEERDFIQKKLLQEANLLAEVFESDSISNPTDDTKTLATQRDEQDYDSPRDYQTSTWKGLYQTLDKEMLYALKPSSGRLIKGFDSEVSHVGNSLLASRQTPPLPNAAQQ